MKSLSLVSLVLAGAAFGLHAAPIDYSFAGVGKSVPDGDAAGVADTQIISTPFTQITSLTLMLTITGRDDFDPFNGDLYATLVHGAGYAVLLNRPGRTAAHPFGNPDNGMSVTFNDFAALGNIHGYADVVSPAPGSPLTGIWMPDGRAADPGVVLDTSPISALLSSFTGLDPNGSWTLFVADLETGGLAALESWSLQIDGINEVPESGTYGVLGLVLLPSLWMGRRSLAAWRRRRSEVGKAD